MTQTEFITIVKRSYNSVHKACQFLHAHEFIAQVKLGRRKGWRLAPAGRAFSAHWFEMLAPPQKLTRPIVSVESFKGAPASVIVALALNPVLTLAELAATTGYAQAEVEQSLYSLELYVTTDFDGKLCLHPDAGLGLFAHIVGAKNGTAKD